MKRIIILAALLFAGIMAAQDIKPTFEKHGDLVKGTFFHQDGQIAQEGFYKNNKLHGEWKAFDKDGKKVSMGQYHQGIKTGKWFFWNNEKLSEVNYDNNTIASVTTWSNKSDVVGNFEN